ncbi:MAG: hypothetical protein H6745_06845 [Deltaproteobacteria bacterium]|nr:hypothetical protein [Deltaproteobacteria bacterium]
MPRLSKQLALASLLALTSLAACGKKEEETPTAPPPTAEEGALPTAEATAPPDETPPTAAPDETAAPPTETTAAPTEAADPPVGAPDAASCAAAYDNITKVTIDDQLAGMSELSADLRDQVRSRAVANMESGRATFVDNCKTMPAAAVTCLKAAKSSADLLVCAQLGAAGGDEGEEGDDDGAPVVIAPPTGDGPVAGEALCKEAYAHIVEISIGDQLNGMEGMTDDQRTALTAQIKSSMKTGEAQFVGQCQNQPEASVRCIIKAAKLTDLAGCNP